MRWADVLVGDVNHLFDSRGLLWGLSQALDWRLTVLVDEAHNLVERTRQMYSAELRASQIRSAAQAAPAALRAPLGALLRAAEALADDAFASGVDVVDTAGRAEPATGAAAYVALNAPPDDFVQALQAASGALADHFLQLPLAVGPLLNFHFELQRFGQRVDTLGEHSLFDLKRDAPQATPGDGDLLLCVRNVLPAAFLRPRFAALDSATLFSATLSPPEHARRLLGLPDDTAWLDVPPAFPPEHLTVRVAGGLSTRFADRRRSLPRLVGVIAQQFDAHPGNYLAFFSSFDYLDMAADRLAAQRPELPQWRQDRRMGTDARQAFLARFVPQGRGIGFAVLGGVFAEGVDLPGSLLIGAFIATLGLPPISPMQDQIRARLDKLLGAELGGAADLIPAMQKVVQAAGRVLRTPEDRGWLWLLDERYRRPEVRALLPGWWSLG